MPNSLSNFIGSLDTLIAVIVGAFLATAGAVIAETLQARRLRKRREQDAARAFGEILASTDRALQTVLRSQNLGDRWGLQTIMFFDGVFRCAGWYRQNIDRLFDIEDMDLRTDINRRVGAFTSVLDMGQKQMMHIRELKETLWMDKKLSAKDKKAIMAQIGEATIHADRWINELQFYSNKIREIFPKLETIAKTKFETNLNHEKYTNPEMVKDPKTLDGKSIPPLTAEDG